MMKKRRIGNDLSWMDKKIEDDSKIVFSSIAALAKKRSSDPSDLDIRMAAQDYLGSENSDRSTYGYWLSRKGERYIVKSVRVYL